MTEKRKGKKGKLEEEKPTKEEYAVAKYLRFSLPNREGKLHGMEVNCFFGNAAVDKLLESKWSASKNQKNPLFTTRVVCVAYMLRLLEKGLFHRAEREKRKKDKDKEKPKKKKEKEGEKEDVDEEKKSKKDKKSRKEKDAEGTTEETEKKESSDKKGEKRDEKQKKPKRLKLVMPDQQFFEDGDEVFVWIYDPVNFKTFLIGLLMVLGAISLCMFPLWPEEVRIGVYYLSLAAAGFVGFILSLVVVRLILFCCIWVLTFGKHHFWFLPNLTEDVGFFDSFRPLYKHDAVVAEDTKSKTVKKKKKKKDDDEKQESSVEDESKKNNDKDDSDEFEVIKKEDIEENEEEELDDDEKAGDEEDEEEGDETNMDSEEEEDDEEPKKTK